MSLKCNNPSASLHKAEKEKVRTMFNDIAPKYDFLNHFLSAGIDIQWRKKVRRLLAYSNPKKILDVATGTGDLAIELSKLKPDRITGVDIATEMLEVGRKKIKLRGLEKIIEFHEGDAENLKFANNSFDAITVAFGVRNFETLQKGLEEMYRILVPGGVVAVLEFSKPKVFPVKQIYNFYFRYMLPGLGKIVSKSSTAYTYLPDSVHGFAEDKAFLLELEKAGFRDTKQKRFTMGIATLYYAKK
ncbi:MAG: bifunctional demethylmenaquinone methyltransferase/2-methoxy-6-polyprenyl-1,4-benzoquinol methylase UbiE [Bacteroidetes bacterium]|nr:bifunctional demethylmenaquinone methyltransferase/2-methoxy-6-polyprenyl-1,4-benzoquinol methylase UbiE [Bacteroidota bacterium]MBL6943898.1 bifunctional demethylmenaquinone methyltransferase/2-methoxy-6-polyprenyl-1,4-benzoquinol methylase UbiE [Bacteroidales bacterium]